MIYCIEIFYVGNCVFLESLDFILLYSRPERCSWDRSEQRSWERLPARHQLLDARLGGSSSGGGGSRRWGRSWCGSQHLVHRDTAEEHPGSAQSGRRQCETARKADQLREEWVPHFYMSNLFPWFMETIEFIHQSLKQVIKYPWWIKLSPRRPWSLDKPRK